MQWAWKGCGARLQSEALCRAQGRRARGRLAIQAFHWSAATSPLTSRRRRYRTLVGPVVQRAPISKARRLPSRFRQRLRKSDGKRACLCEQRGSSGGGACSRRYKPRALIDRARSGVRSPQAAGMVLFGRRFLRKRAAAIMNRTERLPLAEWFRDGVSVRQAQPPSLALTSFVTTLSSVVFVSPRLVWLFEPEVRVAPVPPLGLA